MVLSWIFSSVNFAYKIVEMTIKQKSTNTIQKCKKNKGKMTNIQTREKGRLYRERWEYEGRGEKGLIGI